jgi:hypothetical protein
LGVVVLIVLAAVWAAFLLPPILRARSDHRPSGSISDFRRQLHVLARTSPSTSLSRPVPPTLRAVRPPLALATPAPLRLGRSRRSVKRRRDIFFGLLVAMVGSLVLGALPPLRLLWPIHLVLDAAFIAYVAALLYLRNLAAEREMKVRFLPTASSPEPALLLRRSAN